MSSHQLTDSDIAVLTVAHAAAGVDVDELLARADLRESLAEDGAVLTTAFATSMLDQHEALPDRGAAVALAGHLLVRLMQQDGGGR